MQRSLWITVVVAIIAGMMVLFVGIRCRYRTSSLQRLCTGGANRPRTGGHVLGL